MDNNAGHEIKEKILQNRVCYFCEKRIIIEHKSENGESVKNIMANRGKGTEP